LSITIEIKDQKQLGAGSYASRVMPELLLVSSASSIARMTADAPVLAIAASWVFGALANSASVYGSGGRPVFESTNNDPMWL
jgi:hypothetical protein